MYELSFKNLEVQTTYWIQHFQEYSFTSEHHQGQKYTNVDALSRKLSGGMH
jgi:hypothetical protein